jgi:hypothetical protein
MSSPSEAPIEIPPLPVDGRWWGEHLRETRRRGECIEVTGSHVGLIFNRNAYRAIATALARLELP